MKNLVDKYKDNYVQIYFEDYDSFFVSKIIAEDDECILTQDIDRAGFNDGYQLLNKQLIKSINFNTDYIKYIQCVSDEIAKSGTMTADYLFKNNPLAIDKDNLFSSTLNCLYKEQRLCRLYTDKEKNYIIEGIISEITDKKVIAKYLNEENMIRIEEIVHIDIESNNLRLDYLFDKKYNRRHNL